MNSFNLEQILKFSLTFASTGIAALMSSWDVFIYSHALYAILMDSVVRTSQKQNYFIIIFELIYKSLISMILEAALMTLSTVA